MDQTPFKFLSYYFDKRALTATFAYQGIDNFIFSEKIQFSHIEGTHFNITEDPSLDQILDRAVFMAFIILGVSYFKAHPTPYIRLDLPLDQWQADFFTKVYQNGLSQYAFENGLTRDYLPRFTATPGYTAPEAISDYKGSGILSLQSGGKDSILTAEILKEKAVNFHCWHVSTTDEKTYPAVLDQIQFPKKPFIAVRHLDLEHLRKSGGLNGHVPITYILQSLALIQAIIFNQKTVLTSIGQEGNEPHSMLGDLPVNHQWSKTWEAEQLFAEYVKKYITPDIKIGSPLRNLSEMAIAEQFIQKCWEKYGYSFSSCNRANYKQGKDNSELHWCGSCAKCANTYLLFSPFLAAHPLQSLFADTDLYANVENAELMNNFKGLLGVDGVMKPFECVGSIDELRTAYHHRQPEYASLPFIVPEGHFDYKATYEMQEGLTD